MQATEKFNYKLKAAKYEEIFQSALKVVKDCSEEELFVIPLKDEFMSRLIDCGFCPLQAKCNKALDLLSDASSSNLKGNAIHLKEDLDRIVEEKHEFAAFMQDWINRFMGES